MKRFTLPALLLLTAAVAWGVPRQQRNPKDIWNGVYAGSELRINTEANQLLAQVVADLKPGTALDIGMGQGRNTIFLAARGWDVTGIDISEEGIKQAEAEARRQSLTINAVVADVNEFDYGTARWDLVVGMYMHSLVTNNAEKIMESLKPGGLLVMEGFHRDLNRESVQGGYFGFFTNQLLRVFDRLRILHYQDLRAPADWGGGRVAPIVRFVARKE